MVVLMSTLWSATLGCALCNAKRRIGENPVQMSGSNLCIPRNKTARPHYFRNIIIMFCLPISTFMYAYLLRIYIFPGSVCCRSAYFAAAKQADRSQEYMNHSQVHEYRIGNINRIFGTVWSQKSYHSENLQSNLATTMHHFFYILILKKDKNPITRDTGDVHKKVSVEIP